MPMRFGSPSILAILLVAASPSVALCAETPTGDWLRGSGENLQIRLHGEVLDSNGRPATDQRITCGIHGVNSESTREPTVHGNQFDIWLPVNSANPFSLWFIARSSHNHQVAYKRVNAYELRQTAIDGLRLTLQTPSLHKRFLVQEQGRPVSGATVKIELGYGIELRALSGTDGIAHFDLLADQEISQVTAWTSDFRIGGFSFGRQPTHDPNDDEFVIELTRCRDQRMRFVDQNNSPVAGIDFNLQIATAPPNYNFLGSNENSRMQTDQSGEVLYRWFPDWKDQYFYADLITPGWVLDSNAESGPELVGDTYVFKLKRCRKRQQVVGHVTSTTSDVGGFYVTLESFQAEQENYVDAQSTFADADGSFRVDVLPDARYCAYVTDARWVGPIIDLIPYSPSLEQTNSPELTVSEGQEVQLLATSGPQQKPIPNLTISFQREHPFQWQENGKTQNGIGGPQWSVTTNASGRASTRTLPGKLDVSVYTPKWRTEKKVEVLADEATSFTLHRESDETHTIRGQLISADGRELNSNNIVIRAAAVDGEFDDQPTPLGRDDGSFSFETIGSEVAIFASTKDGQLAGSAIVKKLAEPVQIVLRPTLSYEGRLLDSDHHPLVDHRVLSVARVENGKNSSAPLAKWLEAKRIETRSDELGNFTLSGVPSATALTIYADPIDGSGDLAYLDEIYLQPGESRPRGIHLLGKGSARAREVPLAERYRNTLGDCAATGYRPLLILANGSGSVAEFVHDHFVDSEKNGEVSDFVPITLAQDQVNLKTEDQAFLKERNWWLPDPGHILAVALEPDGTELGRLQIDARDPQAPQAAADFIHAHAPPQHDAEQEWAAAFAEAQRSHRRVWARVSGRYCGPCFSLARWLKDHHDLLEKDYVLLKIDARDAHGSEIARRITRGKQQGIPFHAIFDPDGLLVIDSEGPLGNIGYPSSVEGQQHLKKMLLESRRNLTDAEVEQLVGSIGN
jgi:Thioredoxin-like